ncbi:MAG: efflux RND transporter periplasmic adaptor subunit [Desulforhopalus sp.]
MPPRHTAYLLLMSMIVLFCGCEKHEALQGDRVGSLPAVPVTIARVAKTVASNQIEVVGTVQAAQQAQISAKISGNIITLNVELGSRVKQGELLVELSAEEISAQMQQAKAQLEETRRNLAREESLLKKNAATPESVKTLRDKNRIAEAAYREARTMLDYTKITAPFSGTITRKLADVGDLATPSKPLLYLEDDKRLQILTDIPEAMILEIQKNDRLSVFIPSADLVVEGAVEEISPTVDPTSRSAPVKLHVPFHPKLRSGQFARVTLTSKQAETLEVPLSAVTPYGQMERVFVDNDGNASLRLVRTGAQIGNRVEILSGLQENDKIIVTGQDNLVDGQAITVQ